MRLFFKDERGFSIVQGMIIAAVLAGSGLVATRLISDQKMVQKSSETRGDVEQLHTLIYSTLQNREHCRATIAAVTSPTDLRTSLVNPSKTAATDKTTNTHPQISAIRTGGVSPVIVAQITDGTPNTAYVNGNVRINDIRIFYPIALIGHARLEVTYERLNSKVGTKSGYGAKTITKPMFMRLQRDPTNTGNPFVACYSVTSNDLTVGEGNQDNNRDMCRSLNSTGDPTGPSSLFVWDEATSSCVSKNLDCKNLVTNAGQVFTGINSNGEPECRNIVDWIDYPTLFNGTSTMSCPAGRPNVRLEVNNATKKVRIICD